MTLTKERTIQNDGFTVQASSEGLGRNLPQRVGRRLWLPMLGMALMAFAVGIILAIVRATELDSATPEAETVAQLQHLVPAFMFIGFASVFAAISFAIARILGEFRKGGGEVQETTHRTVQTLKMPATAKAFIGLMMMAMMTILGAVVLHFVAAGSIDAGNLERSEQWAIWLEGVRRTGVAVYLFSILLGLATIVTVLRFQAVRIRQLASEALLN